MVQAISLYQPDETTEFIRRTEYEVDLENSCATHYIVRGTSLVNLAGRYLEQEWG